MHMDIDKPILALGVGLWLWGALPMILGYAIKEETSHIPKWLSRLLVSPTQDIPNPSLFFEIWGLVCIIYALLVGDRTDHVYGNLARFFVPPLVTRICIQYLRKRQPD